MFVLLFAFAIQYLLQTPAPSNLEWIKAWGPVMVGGGAIITSFIASLFLLKTQRAQNRAQNEANTRQFNLVKSQEERDEIVKKLNTFYGQFKQLRTQSRILYAKFAREIAEEFNGVCREKIVCISGV